MTTCLGFMLHGGSDAILFFFLQRPQIGTAT